MAWALYKDQPIGPTVHYIERGIDTGPIVLRRRLPVYRGEHYKRLVRRVIEERRYLDYSPERLAVT
ncbi:MAG: hypothetical protein JXA89_03990 [Anaerolineae bacterium]|nr:hypothetical protein [Anaerolineae bacterium]